MLYSRITYIVRLGGQYSESFKAFAGILIGDPASPILWILYMHDLKLFPHADDVLLNGVRVVYLAQADDIALLSFSWQGLQQKLDELSRWCSRNFMILNAIKTLSPITRM
ncbi:hypothetical protein K474DRAFT_1714162 [Panus rudis PR-1116 ss-1]|nr:hypothetical protein K474DRAFT_1714162 [Panus rudis PR-1116 ss-1]